MNTQKPVFPLLRWLAAWFSGPHLPTSLTLLVLGTIVTHAAMLLIIQPAVYWLDPRQALRLAVLPNWFTPYLVARGPWLVMALALVYLLAAGLLLARLRQSAALALAGMLFFFHTYNIVMLFPFLPDFLKLGLGIVIILVILLAFILRRAPDQAEKLLFGGRRRAAIPALLAAGWLVFLIAMVGRSAIIPPNGWQPLSPQHLPSKRVSMSVAYDTRRGRAVMFGGTLSDDRTHFAYSDETWEWDGKDWSLVHTDEAPSPRRFPSMAYDESRGVIVLFGGENQSGKLGDLWEYDGQQWKKMCPVCNPSSRMGATMVYDPQRKHVVFYGGIGGGKQYEGMWYAEAWAWDGKTWQFQDYKSNSPSAFDPAVAYDTAQQRMVAFFDASFGGTWLCKDNLWTHPNLSPEPPHSRSARMVYDPLYARSILFGGYKSPNGWYQDTWVFEKDVWRKLDLPRSPLARANHIAFYDQTRRSMIVFGGESSPYGIFGDMWELPLGNPTPGLTAKEKP